MKNAELRNDKSRSLNSEVCNSRRSGFTLLELIVVVFIVSLLLAVSLPSFTGTGEGKARSEAKRLASMLRYLNDTALSTKETLHMKVGFKERVIHYKGDDGEKSERFESISGLELPSRGMISDGEVIIFFGPTGASESFHFHLEDGEESLAVSLNALSGRVKITHDEK